MATQFKILSTIVQKLTEPIVRPSMAMDGKGIVYIAGDTNDNAVHVGAFDIDNGKALWVTLLERASNSLSVSPKCSRCYLPRVAALPGGGALISWKRGVKEVVHNTAEFNKSEWGLVIARVNAGGKVLWMRHYQIHKGNGQVVLDPFAPSSCQLIATDGIRWQISTDTGTVIGKLPSIFPVKSSGEKIYSWVTPRANKPGVFHSVTSGWDGCPSLYWNSVINKAVPWAVSSSYRDMNGDMLYATGASPSGRPSAAVILAPYSGCMQLNEWKPAVGSMRFQTSALQNRGSMHSQDRFGIQCCPDPTAKNSVLALVDNRLVRLNGSAVLEQLDPGGWMALCQGHYGQVLVGQVNGLTMKVYGIIAE